MKLLFKFLFLILFIISCSTKKEEKHNNLPVIKASKALINYKIGDLWVYGRWNIAPQIKNDTLKFTSYKQKEYFKFKTDIDSIQFEIKPNTTKNFYVLLKDSLYAHTIIQAIGFDPNQIKHDTINTSEVNIKHQTKPNQYLKELALKYPLDFLNDTMSDTEKILAILNWTNSRWKHNGGNSPSKNDAITILKEAGEGQEFPCFAYAIVLKDQLNALGYKARTVYLKTQDAEHRKSSPGHVVTEVFLNDLQKWVFLDGQFNVMPTLNGLPLNSVELQNAINNNYNQFKLESNSNEKIGKQNYVDFVYDYLFYFDTTLDNRYDEEEKFTINDKRSIMLVPSGAKNITHIDFWNLDINYCIYTNSINDFYAKP